MGWVQEGVPYLGEEALVCAHVIQAIIHRAVPHWRQQAVRLHPAFGAAQPLRGRAAGPLELACSTACICRGLHVQHVVGAKQ